MAPLRAAGCAAVLLFVSLSSSSTDVHSCSQREVTFEELMKEGQIPESDMLQKEVDLRDLLDLEDFPPIEQRIVVPQMDRDRPHIEQRIMIPPLDIGLSIPTGGQPFVGARSFGGPPLDYPVQFPLGRPTPDNIQAICLHGDHRPQYPDSYFPSSGFSKQKRKATAVNNAESWFGTCCKGNQTWGAEGLLCCATQAWERSVKLFCEEDSSVKDRLYDCCKVRGKERLDCFNKDSPNPSYGPTEELPVEPLHSAASFNFDQNICPSPRTNRGATENTGMNFPPGRPTEDNIESLCGNQKLRPFYTTKCLPRSGFELLARKVKTVNLLEKKFKRCCKKKTGILSCADQQWREELNKYCSAKNGEQVDSQCCLGSTSNDRYRCFQSTSPDPHYNFTSPIEEPSLNKICNTWTSLRRSPAGFPLNIVQQCCPLPEEVKTRCILQKLVATSRVLCSSRRPSRPVVRRCCKMPSREEIQQCVSRVLTEGKAMKVKSWKKMKKCPTL